MRDRGVGSWPARRARANGAQIALRYGDTALSYGEFAGRVEASARALRSAGIVSGDRVAYVGANRPEMVELIFATMHLGGIMVPLNMRLSATELAYQLTDCVASLLVYDADRETVATEAARAAGTARCWSTDLLDAHRAAESTDALDEGVDLESPALILYTSGTTGAPKGVVLSHANLSFNAVNVLIELDLASDEVALITTPLFHAAALNMNVLPLMLKGATLVIAGSPRAPELVRLLGLHGVTHIQGVPTIHQGLVDDPGWATVDRQRLRRVVSGGAAASASLIASFAAAGVTFCQGYGMTETGPGALFLPPRSAAAKPGSVGRAMFFTDVQVADTDGQPVPATQPGEVVVSGPSVMAGYWNRPEATTAAFHRGGWYRSGDVGRFDIDGDAYIVDRIKDMYISGGENVYPAEIEAVLNAHPDIAESAVFSVPDDRWGEVGRAAVVTRAGAALDEQGLLEHLRTVVAHFKVPKSVVFVEALPRNATGKIIKAALREPA